MTYSKGQTHTNATSNFVIARDTTYIIARTLGKYWGMHPMKLLAWVNLGYSLVLYRELVKHNNRNTAGLTLKRALLFNVCFSSVLLSHSEPSIAFSGFISGFLFDLIIFGLYGLLGLYQNSINGRTALREFLIKKFAHDIRLYFSSGLRIAFL